VNEGSLPPSSTNTARPVSPVFSVVSEASIESISGFVIMTPTFEPPPQPESCAAKMSAGNMNIKLAKLHLPAIKPPSVTVERAENPPARVHTILLVFCDGAAKKSANVPRRKAFSCVRQYYAAFGL
jgi:hypothetical protein